MSIRDTYARHSKAVTRTARWKVLRMAILERDGFRCRACGLTGRLEVDHIKPVRTHPDLSYAPANLQALCPSCHTRKTRVECGHPEQKPELRDWQLAVADLLGRKQSRPGWSIPSNLGPSAIPVFLVAGPPAAGKSTLIRERAAPGDVIMDFDIYLTALGGQKWETDRDLVQQAFRMRDDALRQLAVARSGRAWFIKGAPSAAERSAWRRVLRRVTEIVLPVDAETCKARIRAEPNRQHAAEKMCAAVDDWWTTYAADRGANPSNRREQCLIP